MATPSSILAWEIPCTEEPGGLQSRGLQRVRHDLATKQQPPSFCKNKLPYNQKPSCTKPPVQKEKMTANTGIMLQVLYPPPPTTKKRMT